MNYDSVMRYLAFIGFSTMLWSQEWSPAKEAALATRLVAEHRRNLQIVENETANSYLAAVVDRLRTSLPAQMPAIRITVQANEPSGLMQFPASFPSGEVFAAARLIVEAPEEAVFVRQLAHAMAHISERHQMRAVFRGDTAKVATIPLVFAGGLDRPALVPSAMQTKFRQFKTEAEALAARMMENFLPDARFVAVQAELRALEPPRKPPTLRRANDPPR